MTPRFRAVDYRRRDDIAIVTMNNPPVNGLSHAVRLGLVGAFEHAIADRQVEGSCKIACNPAQRIGQAALDS